MMILKQVLSFSCDVNNRMRHIVRSVKFGVSVSTHLPTTIGPLSLIPNLHHVRLVSSFDFKDDPTLPVSSVFNVKKTVKSSPFECTEGFACIRTVCPVCNVVPGEQNGQVKNETIYVNKTTGHFTCSACQHLGRWDHIEKFFLPHNKSPRTIQELRKIRDVFLEGKNADSKKSVEIPGEAVLVDEGLAVHVISKLGLKVCNSNNDKPIFSNRFCGLFTRKFQYPV